MESSSADRYELRGLIAQSATCAVFRARDRETGDQVALKLLHALTADDGESLLERYEKASILSRVDHPKVARFVEFNRWNDTFYIAEEYCDGVSLAHALERRSLDFANILEVAAQIAEAVQYCHDRGLLHLGLKPSNVLIQSPVRAAGQSDQIEVRVLGLGQLILQDGLDVRRESVDSLCYMPPEQVGILNKEPTTQSDIYALGVILYEALTGEVPFRGEDGVSTVHQMVAKAPAKPRELNEAIPPKLETLVLRAIAKNPNDRFASMHEFRGRLLEVRRELARGAGGGEVDLSALAEGEEIGLPLCEREVEFERVRVQFDQAVLGRGSLVHITGDPGSGKTRLVEELRTHVVASRGLFLWCQATEFESKHPYAPLRQAIAQFVQHVNGLPQKRKMSALRRIESAVGNFGKALVETLPEIQSLLPGSPELVSLDPERELQRTTKTILNLLQALSNPGAPVVLFIDDFHYADRGTRDIVEKLKDCVVRTNLLVICTESSVAGTEPADELPANDRPRAADELRIHLNPLTQRGCERLFEAGLAQAGVFKKDLATIAWERCGGNPRLVLEIVKTLRDELRDRAEDDEDLDLVRLQRLIPEASVDTFFERHWEGLSRETRRILSVAAVIGRKFELSLVEHLTEAPRGDVRCAVAEGVKLQILTSWSLLGSDLHTFTHERIHDQVYLSVAPEERRRLHGEVARTLGSRAGDNTASRVYEIAQHWLRSTDMVRAKEACLEAAHTAKKAYATQEASYFYTECYKLLEPEDASLELAVLEDLGDVSALAGKYDEAELCYLQILNSVDDRVRKARLEGKIGDMHFRRGKNATAIEHMTKGLRWLGLESPRTKPGLWMSIVWNALRQTVHTYVPKRLLAVANRRARRIGKEATTIFHSLAYAYYFIDLPRTLEVHLRQLNLAERLGESRELAHTYSSHGIVCSLIPLHQRAMLYQHRGLDMRKRLQDRWGIGQSYGFLGVCSYYRSELSQATEYFKQSIRILEAMGDQWEIEAAYSHLGFCHILLGEIDAAEKVDRTLLRLSTEIQDRKFIAISQISLAEIELIRGNYEIATRSIDRALAAGDDNFSIAMAKRVLGQILLRMGRHEDAIRVLEESISVIKQLGLRTEYLVANEVALAEAYLADTDRLLAMGSADRERYLDRVRPLIRRGVRESRKFRNHLGRALRVRGVLHRLRGASRKAARDFEQSRRLLMAQGRIYELALTLLEAARWRSREGSLRDTEDLERALEIFRKVGARPDLEESRALLGLQNPTAQKQQQVRNEHRQLASLFKMSRAISSILDLDRLVVQITDLAVEVTGAERGFLFLRSDGERPRLRCARGVGKRDITFNLTPQSWKIIERTWQRGDAEIASIDDPVLDDTVLGSSDGSSIISVPLKIGDESIGLIHLENRLTRDLYTEDDLEFVTAFASQAAISLQNASLFQRSEELNVSLEQKVQERTRELLHSKQELENANRLKSEFLANMSHELRTPLNAIIAMSEILAERTFGDLGEKQEVYVSQILDSGVHLLALISDVLDLSKVEAGQLELEMDPFNINDLLRGSLMVVKERALKHGIRLEFEGNAEHDVLMADARRVKQVVFNLLSNAVKFTPDGGRVTLRSVDGPDSVIVEVEDDGIGISETDQKIIFDEFRQADSSYTRKYEGTGLGLALCKKFVELHGGRIWVHSELDKGSTFGFSLPLNLEAANLEVLGQHRTAETTEESLSHATE